MGVDGVEGVGEWRELGSGGVGEWGAGGAGVRE